MNLEVSNEWLNECLSSFKTPAVTFLRHQPDLRRQTLLRVEESTVIVFFFSCDEHSVSSIKFSDFISLHYKIHCSDFNLCFKV